jgi:hypothetical protein
MSNARMPRPVERVTATVRPSGEIAMRSMESSTAPIRDINAPVAASYT